MRLNRLYDLIWGPSCTVLQSIEREGMPYSAKAAARLEHTLTAEVDTLQQELDKWSDGVNWQSPKQVAEYLYVRRGFRRPPIQGTLNAVKRTKQGDHPTSVASLDYLSRTLPDADDREHMRSVLQLRALRKQIGFLAGLHTHMRSDNRIHCQLAATTATGRLACKNPNLQQIPPSVRDCFVAPPGFVFVAADYAALEWRVLAHMLALRYDDTSLVDDVRAGVDPHSATAHRMFRLDCAVEDVKSMHPRERHAAKSINYGINYGKTAEGLGIQLLDEHGVAIGTAAARGLIDAFYSANPDIRRLHTELIREVRATGYSVSLLGRRRMVDTRARSQTDRIALNSPIQSTAADIVTLAMLRCHTDPSTEVAHCAELSELGARLVLQIHDELLFLAPERNAEQVLSMVTQHMQHCVAGVVDFRCPLSATGGVGATWREAGGK